MSATDPTPAADRRALAKRAHLQHAEWPAADYFDDVLGWAYDAGDFIAANDPTTVLADLDLIDAYRELVAAMTRWKVSPDDDGWKRLVEARARVAELEAQR